MRIAFIDHEFHVRTRSSVFMIDFLRTRGDVTVHLDTTYRDGGAFDLAPFRRGDYDLIVVWQMATPAIVLSHLRRDRLVFVPMFDGAWDLPDQFWRELKDTRILSFCGELHARIRALGGQSLRVQYYPEASPVDPEQDFRALHGFFWPRTRQVDVGVVSRLIGTTRFERFHIHRADDPGEPTCPITACLGACAVTTSHWLECQSDFQRLLERSNVFFASRTREGIGMSFLEAMARGQCVVAPDRATMSEYIEHGVNGLLYDPDDPQPLDFSQAARIGAAARASVAAGYEKWRHDRDTLVARHLFDSPRTLRTAANDLWQSVKRTVVR